MALGKSALSAYRAPEANVCRVFGGRFDERGGRIRSYTKKCIYGWDFFIRSLRPVSLNKDWSLAMQYIPYAQTHDGASQIEMCAHRHAQRTLAQLRPAAPEPSERPRVARTTGAPVRRLEPYSLRNSWNVILREC